MMMSPENYIDILYEVKKYKELIEMREELLNEIHEFEDGTIPSEAHLMHPSPEVIYQLNLEYLSKICGLISEKYREEYSSIDDDDFEEWVSAQ